MFQFAHKIYFISSTPSRLSVSRAFLRSGFLPGEMPSEFLNIEAVGESGADLMVFAYHKAVFVSFRVCKADVLGSAEQVHVDICADALQYGVGFFLYLKKEQNAVSAGE